jgi:hypothetical protein
VERTRQRSHSSNSAERSGNNRGKIVNEQTRGLEIKLVNAYVALIVTLGSVSNNKFYIPGETKEVEGLRRKAIMNGILVFVQAVI